MVAETKVVAKEERVPKRFDWVDYFPLGVHPNAPEARPQCALVTFVHSPNVVNLQVFYDGAAITSRTSICKRAENVEGTCWDFAPGK